MESIEGMMYHMLLAKEEGPLVDNEAASFPVQLCPALLF